MMIREKIEAYGVKTCTTDELVICATGKSAHIETLNDFEVFVSQLTPAKKGVMMATMELVRRLGTKKPISIIHSPDDAAEYARPILSGETKEMFYVMLLNIKNRVLKFEKISMGSLTASIVHPREVFEAAVRYHAAAMLLVHNHPSGDPTPSREDISVTQRLVKAGKIMDIQVIDHIIVGDNTFTSMKEKGLLA